MFYLQISNILLFYIYTFNNCKKFYKEKIEILYNSKNILYNSMILSHNLKIKRDVLKRQLPRLFLLLVLLYMHSIIFFLLIIIFRFCLTCSIKGSRAAVLINQHCWLKLKHLKCNKKNSSSNSAWRATTTELSQRGDNVHKKRLK